MVKLKLYEKGNSIKEPHQISLTGEAPHEVIPIKHLKFEKINIQGNLQSVDEITVLKDALILLQGSMESGDLNPTTFREAQRVQVEKVLTPLIVSRTKRAEAVRLIMRIIKHGALKR